MKNLHLETVRKVCRVNPGIKMQRTARLLIIFPGIPLDRPTDTRYAHQQPAHPSALHACGATPHAPMKTHSSARRRIE